MKRLRSGYLLGAQKLRATNASSHPTIFSPSSPTALSPSISSGSKMSDASTSLDSEVCRKRITRSRDAMSSLSNDHSETSSMGSKTIVRESSASSNVNLNERTGLPNPVDRAPSHDSNIVLPSLSISPLHAMDSFPVFKNGDVVIKTELDPKPKTFQLHSAVLCRHSPYFAYALRLSAQDITPPSWHLFSIEEVDGAVALVRQNAEGKRPEITCSQLPNIIDAVHIKIEGTDDEPPSTLADDSIVYNASPSIILTSYTQVLASFYNIPPDISTARIDTALVQSESLTKIATELGCLHLLRPHLGNIFSQYRQKLFLAIKSDPARWCQLALSLENTSIYSECLVHLIGVHPRWHPKWATKRTALSEDLRGLIKRKSEEIAQTCTELERDLLLSTIPYGRKSTPLDPTQHGQAETWILVQVFRDQLAQMINALDRDKEGCMRRGSFFREISRGTLSSLDTEKIRAICQGTMRTDWKDLGEDLKRLKDYAAELIEELAANELMIDPDVNDVGYLTCAKIRNDDIPWLVAS